MAKFDIELLEGMHYVKATLDNESMQAEAGALSSMTGAIEMTVKVPSVGRIVKSYLSEEGFFRPTYTGTGIIFLEASFGGFHVLDVNEETWVLESGSYWASEGALNLSAYREKMWTTFWAGDGLIDWQTKVSGRGKVVIASAGPLEELTLEKGKPLVANGKYVVARTADVTYSIRRVTKSYLASYAAGEGHCRVYDGPGRVLVCYSPYWRHRLFSQDGAMAMAAS
ncbi:MAG: AIM24 family protein [Sphingomonadales bacterium]|nr:AIM24 family protein [Sphingomonadales bacterium]